MNLLYNNLVLYFFQKVVIGIQIQSGNRIDIIYILVESLKDILFKIERKEVFFILRELSFIFYYINSKLYSIL